MSGKTPLGSDFDFHGNALDRIFETYAHLRDKCPVGYSGKHGGFWFLTKSEDIFAAEQDHERFSVTPSMLLPPFGTDVPLIPIDIDPPKHLAYRRILLPLFTPQAVDKLESGIRQVARDLAKRVLDAGIADVSHMFARPLPTIVFGRLAGYPEKDWPKFDAWVDEIIYSRSEDPGRAHAAGQAVMDYFSDLLSSRKDLDRTDDLIGHLLNAKVDGIPLSHEELLSYCYLLFLAGLDTTAWAIRASLWYLGQNPKEQKRLRENPELIPAAGEEFLRTLSPVQAMARTCKKDVTIRGHKISAGQRVVLVFGSGNRDPEVYDQPDEIRIDRENNRHLAFGVGIHRCLGSNLGRRELVVALQEFLGIVPEFTLADPAEQWHGVGSLVIKIRGLEKEK